MEDAWEERSMRTGPLAKRLPGLSEIGGGRWFLGAQKRQRLPKSNRLLHIHLKTAAYALILRSAALKFDSNILAQSGFSGKSENG